MIPDPLHPAVVHFPLVLALLLPIFALASLWAIRRGADTRRAWGVAVVAAALVVASAWAALATGEAEEERVEGVVAESVLHEHEEAAERLLVVAGLVLLVAGAGLLGGTVGAAGRMLATAGSLAVVAAAISVGSAGGELVYRHGAASPYVAAAAGAGAAPGTAAPARERDEEDD